MASSKDRQRKLARAKLDRQLARRASRERRRRRMLAGLGASLAVVLIATGIAWLAGAFDNKKPTPSADASDLCAWTPQSAQTNTDLKEVGTPPTKGFATSGTRTMTISTNQGAAITVSLDLAAAPCASESLAFLASKKFYDNTDCSEITTEGAVHCGDPAGNGLGGPTYSFYNEHVPSAPTPAPSASAAAPTTPALYPAGTVAMTGNPPGTNGSQFLIFFKDFRPASPQYTIVGTVTGGMATLTKISKIPTVANSTGSKVKPSTKVTIQSLTVGDVAAGAGPAPSASTQS